MPDWTGQPVVIVASGPSAMRCSLEDIRGRARVVAVNSSIRLCPWADVLQAHDVAWWRASRKDWQGFGGLKVAMQASAKGVSPDIHVLTHAPHLSWDRGHVYGPQTGLGALNFALQCGARRIVLVGFDMHDKAGTHWHGKHPLGLRNPPASAMARWARTMDAADVRDAEIVVANPDSALTAFRKMEWKEAAAWI